MKINYDISEIDKKILNLSYPAIVSNLSQNLMGVIDVFFVSRLGAKAIAVSGLSWLFLWLSFTVFLGITTGATVLITRFFAQKKYDKVEDTYKQALFLGFLYAVPSILVVYFAGKFYFMLMTKDVNVILLGEKYLKILILTRFFNFFTIITNSVLNAVGNTKTPMYVRILANIINIVLDYILIWGTPLNKGIGLMGSAWASLIARFISGFFLFILIVQRKLEVKLNLLKFKLKFFILKKIIKYGLPRLFEQLSISLGYATFTGIISHLGPNMYAAHQLSVQFEGLSYMSAIGFSIATSTLVGQSLGLKKVDCAHKIFKRTSFYSALFSGFIGIIFFFFGANIISLFIKNSQVIYYGSLCLKVAGFIQIPQALNFVIAGGLRGAGDTKFTFLINALGMWIIRIPISIFFVYKLSLGLIGAWYVMAIDILVKLVLFILRYKSDKWVILKI